jgi:hypothetical protein
MTFSKVKFQLNSKPEPETRSQDSRIAISMVAHGGQKIPVHSSGGRDSTIALSAWARLSHSIHAILT